MRKRNSKYKCACLLHRITSQLAHHSNYTSQGEIKTETNTAMLAFAATQFCNCPKLKTKGHLLKH